ncbi:MAG: SufS family cysteine desulfurase [Bacteroidota bacterium]|nr:SufS family cysteine desulfurase [Bacteroidota bacterium]
MERQATSEIINNAWVEAIRKDFPILHTKVYGKNLVYLDNAATSQKPQVVIDRLVQYYTTQNSNIHRGVHYLAGEATDAYESARMTIARHLNAPDHREIIFTRGATEGLNLIASSWGGQNLKPNDEVLITGMEHHANMVPWQIICEKTGAKLKYIPVFQNGTLDLSQLTSLITDRTKIISAVWISNSIGTINPIAEIIAAGKANNIPVVVDACQAAPHYAIDVQELDADFLVFSGHKVFAPTGIGVLWAKAEHLNQMPPYQSGGDMIDAVYYDRSTYADIPNKFEAGTPHIAGTVALATAMDYVENLGRAKLQQYEQQLTEYVWEGLSQIPEIQILGPQHERIPAFSMVIDGVHPLDLGTFLDLQGIAVRTGNHCTQPLLNHLGVNATARASFAFYNTFAEVDYLVETLTKTISKLKR